MKKIVTVGMLCLLLQSGCYVRTRLQVESLELPAGFSPPVLAVAVQEKAGLGESRLAELEQVALRLLAANGIRAVTLKEALGDAPSENAVVLLRENNYLAYLKIVIDFWGSRTETLPASVPPSVDSIQTDRDSSFYPPGSIESTEQPGPSTSYKEVQMTASLADLKTDRLVWFGRVRAGPGVVGRSFLYHRFNRALQYEELATSCLKKIVRALARILPQSANSSTP